MTDSGRYYAKLSNGNERQVKAPENISSANWNLVVENRQPGEKVTRQEDRG